MNRVSLMNGKVMVIDPSVKDELLRYPTAELIRLLFPDVQFRGRSVLCNPLRGEKHPSLSCFRSYDGYPRWKDHATGQVGDNIDFFRLANPDLGYVEAVDALAKIVLGRSALSESGSLTNTAAPFVPARARRQKVCEAESPGLLRITGVVPYADKSMPASLMDYVRGRGISDDVAKNLFYYVTFVNLNKEGSPVIDPSSGLPVVDSHGDLLRNTGKNLCIGMPNDLGGFSLRVPDTDTAKGFKGTNASFLTSVLSDGSFVMQSVRLFGEDEPLVRFFRYDERHLRLYINETVGFEGVCPWAVRYAIPFLDDWSGRYLEGRELRCAVAVLSSLNCSPSYRVAVVEGMFDCASLFEMARTDKTGPFAYPSDILVLNSISNLRWAVPFLTAHPEVCSYLDNDMRSAAGQKAFVTLQRKVAEFAARAGVCPCIFNGSSLFYPSKDVNDFLMSRKGFDVKANNPTSVLDKTSHTRNRRASNQNHV